MLRAVGMATLSIVSVSILYIFIASVIAEKDAVTWIQPFNVIFLLVVGVISGGVSGRFAPKHALIVGFFSGILTVAFLHVMALVQLMPQYPLLWKIGCVVVSGAISVLIHRSGVKGRKSVLLSAFNRYIVVLLIPAFIAVMYLIYNKSSGIEYEVTNTDERASLVAWMDKVGIEYRVLDSGSFLIERSDFGRVKKRVSGDMPDGKSGAYIDDPKLRYLFKEELRMHSIESHVITIEGKEWLQWPSKDAQKAEEIFDNLVLNKRIKQNDADSGLKVIE